MAGAEDDAAGKAAEITEMVRQLREQVRAHHPEGAVGETGVRVADLMPLVHARDDAQATVAAIGSVNPRPAGVLNSLVQTLKRWLARALDRHVRQQVEFNRAVVDALNSAIGALNETNRALAETATLHYEQRRSFGEQLSKLRADLDEARDIRTHWQEWRQGWEQKLATNEIQFLRSVADLQASFQHRVTQIESNFRDLVRSQHDDFTMALEKSGIDIQKRLWRDMGRIREEYERLIHNELHLLRQRMLARAPSSPSPTPVQTAPAAPGLSMAPAVPAIDSLHFADRFRGREDYVKQKMTFYADRFRGAREVLDLGCGRGEFLEVMREAGIPARGVDINEEFVSICRGKKLRADQVDLFTYLDSLADGAMGGINCSQVVEHLPPERLPELVRLAAVKLARGGLLALETPNPECLAIFASHFYLDPTHTRPIPPPLMVFYLEEAGFGAIGIHSLSPAAETMPSVATLPETFREAFFGGLDYAVLAKKL